MSKLLNNFMRSQLSLSLTVFLAGMLIVVLTITDEAFFSIADMGNSAIGMALSRTIHKPIAGAPEPFLGYILNGSFTWYGNWPPIGFQTLAWWFDLTQDDSIWNARIFSALVYGFNAMLFFLLMLKTRLSKQVSLLSALIFILLPFHLEYGKLIYPDIWVLTFWLLALLTYTPGTVKKYWLFALIIIIGSLMFMWFIIFMLPLPLLIYWFKKRNWSPGWQLLSLLAIVAVIYTVQWGLFKFAGDNYLVQSLTRWSVFGLEEYLLQNPGMVIKRALTLSYESSPVILLLILSMPLIGKKRLVNKLKQREPVGYILKVAFITLFIYVAAVPSWFINHTHATGMFAIFFSTSIAFLLQALQDEHPKRVLSNSIITASCSLVMFLGIPYLSSGRINDYQNNVNGILALIEQKRSNEQALCLFFELSDSSEIWPPALIFAIKEQSDTYVFFQENPLSHRTLEEHFRAGMNNLISIGIDNFDTTRVIFITDMPQKYSELIVLDSVQLTTINAYEIDL
jgi:hypothetical protein